MDRKEKIIKYNDKGYLTTREFVEIWATDKQKESFGRNGKLASKTREIILSKARRYCIIEPFKSKLINGDGRKVFYRIESVFDDVVGIETNGYLDKSKSALLIQKLLLNNLCNTQGSIIMSFNDIAYGINMVNRSFRSFDEEVIEDISNNNMVNQYNCKLFFISAKNSIREMIRSAMESMKKRDMIYYEDDLFLCVDEDEDVDVEYGHTINTFNGEYKRKATEEEKVAINEFREEALKELGFDNSTDAMFKDKHNIFYRKVSSKLKKSNYDYIKYYFKGYKIDCDKVLNKYELEYELWDIIVKELNTVVIEKITQISNNRYNSKSEKAIFGEIIGELNPIDLKGWNKLINKYIKI